MTTFNVHEFSLKHRIVTLLLAVALLLCSVLCACDNTSIPDEESLADEYSLERGENEKQITFYFNRSAGGYSDCDVWLWYDNADGRGYPFHECQYGGKAVINVPDTVTKVGFIVRTACSDPGGTSWGSATKDATESDRFAELTGDETVYYLKSGDALLYTSEDGGKTLNAMKKIVMGDIADLFNVKFVLNSSMKVQKDDVTIKAADGRIIEVADVDSPGGILGTIKLAEELDITKEYTLAITGMDEVKIMPCTYFSTKEFADLYSYDGELGVIIGDNETVFKLWAPTATEVILNLFEDGSTGSAYKNIAMTKGDKGVWSYTAGNDVIGKYYTYSVTTSAGKQEAVDPYARSSGINGKRGMIIDLRTSNPQNWSDDLFDNNATENYTDAVIWEIQIRDFSNTITSSQFPGKYLAFTESGLKNEAGIPVGLDYLKELGITHVHLMPAYDFASVDESKSTGYNWGYDPQNYNVPEGSYSTDPSHGEVRVNEFKQMVQALHDAGIGVVMDVVYNHTYDANSNLNKVVPYYYYRYTNGSPSNGSGCGNETASERTMFRKYIIDSVIYWATEYHIDGFRFDLMGVHDTETMKQVEKALHAINPKALIYGEGWTGGTVAIPNAQQSTLANIKTVNADSNINGIAMFNDVIRDAIKGSTDGKDTGFATGAKSFLLTRIKFGVIGGVNNFAFSGLSNPWTSYSPTNMINYASAHDNLALWDKICYAYGEDSTTLEDRLKRNALSASIVMTSLGVPFMQGGEEMLRSKKNSDRSYNHNSYNSSDAVNNLKWDLLSNDSEQYQMMQYYKGLIEFRKSSTALRSASAFDENGDCICTVVKESGTFLAFTVCDGNETVLVIYNAGETDAHFDLPSGSWDLFINGTVSGTDVISKAVSGSVTIPAISCYVYRLS